MRGLIARIAVCGLAVGSVACDSAEKPEECVAETETVTPLGLVPLVSGPGPQATVGRLSFVQELIRYTGSHCTRPTEGVVSVVASNESLWQTASYAFAGTFTHENGSWDFEGSVSGLAPRDQKYLGIVSLEPFRIDAGEFEADVVGAVTFGEPVKPTLVVTGGGCGHLIYREKAGADYAAALAVVQARERAAHPAWTIVFEPYPVEVRTRDGAVVPGTFTGVALKDPATGSSWHGVFDVITDQGEVYFFQWCED